MFQSKKIDESIMSVNLTFKENSTENEYLKSVRGYKQKSFRFFQIAVLILLTASWLLNPLATDNFSTVSTIANVIQIFLHIIAALYLCFKKDFRHPEIGILILQIYNCFGYVESYQKNIRLYSRTTFITSSTLLEMNILVSMISRCSWKMNGFSAFILNTYLCLRFTDLVDIREMRGLPLLVFTTNFIIITLGSFLNEKYDRRLFYERYNNEQTLKRFEEIIKEGLPSSILIYRENELLFYNEQTLRMLNIAKRDEVEDKLKKIIITSSEYKETEKITIPKDDLFADNPLISQDINNLEELNLILYFKGIKSTIKDRGFLRLTGIYDSSEPSKFLKEGDPPNTDNPTQYLDIKIGKIAWKGDDALLVILSEDFALHRLHYLQEQGKYKDKLLATVSHDLRTPLNGVIGMLDLALESKLEKSLRKSLQLALRSSQLLLFMINDILDFSQISNGRLNINPMKFNIAEMIVDVTKLIKFQAKKKGLSFSFFNKLPANGKFNLYSDPNRLKQIILNLLGNALKFTKKGFLRISCELNDTDEEAQPKINPPSRSSDPPPIKITVEDSGCGIRKEDIPKLFKLFGMLDNKESKSFNTTGVGLGLAISQNLVKILNNYRPEGVIKVRSDYGKGSEFSFLIHDYKESPNPVVNALDNDHLDIELLILSNEEWVTGGNNERYLPLFESNSNVSVIKSHKAKKKILLVDDDQINILVLTKLFDKFDDCEYEIAFDGEDAINKVRKKANNNDFFDVIFMDCNMPIMNGFEATKIILKMVAAREIPKPHIIASTANASQEDKEYCFECGMQDFMSKPFTKKCLREKIDFFLYKN